MDYSNLSNNLKDLGAKTKRLVKEYCKNTDINNIYVFWDIGGDFEGGLTYKSNCPHQKSFRAEFVYSIKYNKFYTIAGYNLMYKTNTNF